MSLEEFLSEWNNDSPFIEVKTSGSTGEPKRMLVEKRRMLASARITCDFLGLRPGDTALLCMSLDYIAGKMMVVRALERHLTLLTVPPTGHPLSSLSLPSSFLLPPSDILPPSSSNDSPSSFLLPPSSFLLPPSSDILPPSSDILPPSSDILPPSSFLLPRFTALVPLQVYNTLQVPEERERLMQVEHLIIGGGAIDEAMEAELRQFPNAVWSTYGMTETLSHIALRRISGPEASEWYTPFPSVHLSLSDEGCLIIDAPEVCAETLITNDIAELSPLGEGRGVAFRILGRKDNVICSGGLKIQAEELERQLRPHMRVPFIISKRPDEKFGEIVVLVTEGSPTEARTICERILPKFHQPKEYLHLDHIPLTETSKPARQKVLSLLDKRTKIFLDIRT